MLLAADVGNTSITFGIFNNYKIIKIFRIPSDINISEQNFLSSILLNTKDFDITSAVIGSVVDGLGEKVKICIDKIFNINSLLLDSDSKKGMKIFTEHPELVGMDRIANIAGAKEYPNPKIIIDFGTATTFDITDKDGNFFGGIIMPGINTQLQSLHSQTSKLPLIKPKKVKKIIANDTESCILSGVIKGHACAIEGLIPECEKELGQKVSVIGTGGLLDIASEHMSRKFDHKIPNLTLIGLKNLYLLNQQN